MLATLVPGLLAAVVALLHGVLVPLTHRLGRARTGRTVHLEPPRR